MKLGRATGIIIAGWFLMIPPLLNGRIDPKAPLSKWTYDHFDYFVTRDACEAEINSRREAARIGYARDEVQGAFGATLGSWVLHAARVQIRYARCVSEDTPGIEWN